jgi:hypothetical protein
MASWKTMPVLFKGAIYYQIWKANKIFGPSDFLGELRNGSACYGLNTTCWMAAFGLQGDLALKTGA